MISFRCWRRGRFELSLFRPQSDGWQLAAGIRFEGHPWESRISVDLLLWQLVVWWSHR